MIRIEIGLRAVCLQVMFHFLRGGQSQSSASAGTEGAQRLHAVRMELSARMTGKEAFQSGSVEKSAAAQEGVPPCRPDE